MYSDLAALQRMGKSPKFNRNFGALSILAFSVVLIGTWPSMLASVPFSLIDGGRAGTVFDFVGSWCFQIGVTASLAEMVSMAPTSAGQYHWVSEFAPRRQQKLLSYQTGWFAAIAWQGFVAYTAFFTGQLTLSIVSVAKPEYSPTAWQGTLVTIGVTAAAAAFNIFEMKRLPLFEGLALVIFVIDFFAILVGVWIFAPRVPAKEVFGDFQDFGGWGSIGLACTVGQLAAGGALLGADCVAHMAEEVLYAGSTVPLTMMLSTLLSGATGFVMVITIVFIITDVQSQVVDSTAVYPFIEVFAQSMGTPRAVGLTVPVAILAFCSCVSSLATASRQAFAFAEDRGFVFSETVARLTQVSNRHVPCNAILMSCTVSVVFALLNLGGSEIFDSITGLTVSAVLSTYCLAIGSVLWRRCFGADLPMARFSLGKFGWVVNLISLLYAAQLLVFASFPLFARPSAKTMNWGVVTFAGLIVVTMANYLVDGRTSYISPRERMDGAQSAEEHELHSIGNSTKEIEYFRGQGARG